MKKTFTIILIVAVLIFTLVACGEKDDDFKVIIHPNNGEVNVEWDINDPIPSFTKEGYVIEGFYLDGNFGTATSLEELKVNGLTGNIDVYIKWEMVPVVCEHTLAGAVEENRVEATCTKDGSYDSVIYCLACSAEISRESKKLTAGHIIVEHEAKEPDCNSEVGWKAYETCSRCDYTTYEEIPAGHNMHDLGWCVRCGWQEYVYQLNEGGESYALSGVGKDYVGTTLRIPNEYNGKPVTAICDWAFDLSISENASYSDFVEIIFEQNSPLTTIGTNAFYGWEQLSTLNIPDSLTTIGVWAFGHCHNLVSVTFGKDSQLTSIEDAAFIYCYELTNITIPNSVTTIGGGAFAGCTSLTSIAIPEGVTTIESNLFRGCTSLTNVIIPNGVTAIGDASFDGCESLASISIPSTVTAIGKSAFGGCESLKSIIIPDSVTTLGVGVFQCCSELKSVIIPESVTTIGEKAFFDCTSLTDIYYKGTEEQWNELIINVENSELFNVTIHCNYVPEAE